MKRLLLLALIGLSVFPILYFAFLSHADEAAALIAPDPALLDDMFNRINQLRTRRGIEPLARNPLLDAAAQNQAEWLVTTGIRGHYRPDGSKPSTRAREAGYTYQWCCGENYYMSIDATPDMVWEFWRWSRSHYWNMVNRNFDDVGLGWSSNGRRISYVLVFGDALEPGAAIIPQQPAPTATPVPQTSLVSQAGAGEHIVQPGETLFHIAVQYGTSVQALSAANHIVDPTLIYPGQRLVMPGGTAPVQVAPPPPTPVPQPQIQPAAPLVTSGQLTYTVQPGESLFRIAMNYGTSVQAIAQANGITDPTLISAGQQLVIPNPGSGFGGLPSVQQGQPAGIGQAANCSGFVPTSPLGGMALGPVTFYWDPAPGATSYRVNVYGPEGALWFSATTSGAETNISLDTKQFGTGYSFQLDVEALVNGAPVCRTSRVSLARAAS